MTRVVEQVTFKAKAGVDIADLFAASDSAQAVLQTQDGFLSRQLCIDPDSDEIVDIIQWRDIDAARGAMMAVMGHPQMKAFFGLIDESTMVMRHLNVVGSGADAGGSPATSPNRRSVGQFS